MIVVSDNSPLQYLILIECIHALPALYGQVLTTPQVMRELQHAETPEGVRKWAAAPPTWLMIETPKSIDFLDILHEGEASAISLANERHADLVLIDERAGSHTARKIGLQAIGNTRRFD
jgi:predicted nucleic acid-binding protein